MSGQGWGGGVRRGVPRPARGGVSALVLAAAMLAAAALLTILPTAPRAQSLLLNNYNRIPIGESGGLEGGAFVARANDSSAGWYNPAGLVKARRDSLSGNAALYELTRTQVGDGAPVNNINNIANFVGGVSRWGEETDDVTFVWGWSVAVPSQLQSSSSRQFTRAGDVEVVLNPLTSPPYGDDDPVTVTLTELEVSTVSSTGYSVLAPGIAAGYAVSDTLRLGLGLRAYRVEVTRQLGITAFQAFEAGDPYFNLVESRFTQGTSNLLRLEGGLQWDMGRGFTFGANFRSPTYSISSDGTFRISSLLAHDADEDSDGETDSRYTEFTRVNDDSVDFSYKLPLEFAFGLAWVGERFEFEVDAFVYGPVSPFELFGPVEVFRQVQTHSRGVQFPPEETDPIYYEAQSMLNIALGGTYKFSDAAMIHGGFFSDLAPGAGENTTFDEVNNYGVTFGTTLFQENTSTSFGLVYTYGANPAAQFEDPLTGEVITASQSLQTLSLVAAGSVFF